MTAFTWLDYSDTERRQMMDIISLFGEKTTRDELGIGAIRDALANIFFPGTSTIQTRARYFFFVPWIYLTLENRYTPSRTIASKARKAEVALIHALKRAGVGEGEGLIGYRSEGNLQRLPSNIYWQGLSRYGLRQFPGSQYAYHKSLDNFYRHNNNIRAANSQNEWLEPSIHNWHPAIFDFMPDNFPNEATFDLTAAEGSFLSERIISTTQGSLLAWLITHSKPWEQVDFPWQHPQFGTMPSILKGQLTQARNFAEALEAAPLIYNLMLAEKAESSELIDFYREELLNWAQMMSLRAEDFRTWDLSGEFWPLVYQGNPSLKQSTRNFITNWLRFALSDQQNLAENSHARNLILQRERQLKRSLARLDNPRALELWTGAAGVGRLNYRWFITQSLLTDILEAVHHA